MNVRAQRTTYVWITQEQLMLTCQWSIQEYYTHVRALIQDELVTHMCNVALEQYHSYTQLITQLYNIATVQWVIFEAEIFTGQAKFKFQRNKFSKIAIFEQLQIVMHV